MKMNWFPNLFKKTGIESTTIESQYKKTLLAINTNEYISTTTTNTTDINIGETKNVFQSGIGGGIFESTTINPFQPAPQNISPLGIAGIKTIIERVENFHKDRKHKKKYSSCKACKVITIFHDYEQKLYYKNTKTTYPPGMAGTNLHWDKKKTEEKQPIKTDMSGEKKFINIPIINTLTAEDLTDEIETNIKKYHVDSKITKLQNKPKYAVSIGDSPFVHLKAKAAGLPSTIKTSDMLLYPTDDTCVTYYNSLLSTNNIQSCKCEEVIIGWQF